MPKRKKLADQTALDVLVDQAVEAQRELEGLPPRLLSAAAFSAWAMQLAEADDARLDQIEAQLGDDARELARCVREIGRRLRDGHVPEPPADPAVAAKFVRAYAMGSRDEVRTQMTALDISAHEVIAIAARREARARPGSFGDLSLQELRQRDEQHDALQERLARLYVEMRGAVSPADQHVERIDEQVNVAGQRVDGLTRVSFRRAPTINLGMPDWPTLLVRHVLHPPAPATVQAQPGPDALDQPDSPDLDVYRRDPASRIVVSDGRVLDAEVA